MSTTGSRVRPSNAQVARSMLIVGIALIVVAVVLDFMAPSIVPWLNDLAAGVRDFATRLWSVVIRLGYALGPFLAVGSIIVGRLPEQALPQHRALD